MKLLTYVDADTIGKIHQQFPHLQDVYENTQTGMQQIAISVFDHWLHDPAEWGALDCVAGPERASRDHRFAAHWAAIFDLTTVYTLRRRGRWPHKSRLILKQYSDRQGFLERCRFDANAAPSQFVVLPEYGCIYVASWDDTNILYFNERRAVQSILQLAPDAGLHVLEPIN